MVLAKPLRVAESALLYCTEFDNREFRDVVAPLFRQSNKAWTLVLPLFTLIVVSPMIYLDGYHNLAWLVSNLGTVLVLTGNLVYVVFFDSKKRWPKSSPFDRFARLVTFDR